MDELALGASFTAASLSLHHLSLLFVTRDESEASGFKFLCCLEAATRREERWACGRGREQLAGYFFFSKLIVRELRNRRDDEAEHSPFLRE